jgi:hypothetical protein
MCATNVLVFCNLVFSDLRAQLWLQYFSALHCLKYQQQIISNSHFMSNLSLSFLREIFSVVLARCIVSLLALKLCSPRFFAHGWSCGSCLNLNQLGSSLNFDKLNYDLTQVCSEIFAMALYCPKEAPPMAHC